MNEPPQNQASVQVQNQASGPPENQESGPPEIQEPGPPQNQESGPPQKQESGAPQNQESGAPQNQASAPAQIQASDPGPKDRYYLVYSTLLLHGLGILTSWEMFIMAKDYYVEYKLKGTPYGENFLVYIGYAAQLPNLMFCWFNVFFVMKGSLSVRIVVSLLVEVFVFLATVILAMVDSSEWTAAFFWITMLLVFLLNAFNAIYQTCIFGVAAQLPDKYTGGVMLGSNIVGTLVALLSWATSTAGNLKVAAIYFFIVGMCVLLMCLDTYIALPLNKFYRYHHARIHHRGDDATIEGANIVPYRLILKDCWVQLYNVFMCYFVALCIFPVVHSDIYSVDNPKRVIGEGFLGENFTRITCFLTFNLMAVVGNLSATFFRYPTRDWLAVFTTARLVLVPIFLMCNYHPKGAVRTMPVIIKSDWLYWFFAVLLGWSLGHGGTLSMMYVGGNVKPEWVTKAGMIGGATLISGIVLGITFAGVACRNIVTAKFWT